MKRSAEFLKSSAACLCYYTAHAVPISYGIWMMIRRIVDKTYNTKIMDLLMLNSFKRKRKLEEEIKSFGNSNIRVLFLFANLLFNLISKVDLFICDITKRLPGVVMRVPHTASFPTYQWSLHLDMEKSLQKKQPTEVFCKNRCS